jgi:hypothetical protein
MATIQQIQAGAARFIDNELIPAFTGWQKVLIGGGAGLLLKNLPQTLAVLAQNPMVAALGVYNAQNGTVDVDALANAFLPQMGAEALPITIPGGVTVRLTRADIEKLIRYIKEA